MDFNTSVILCESYKYVSNVCTMNPSLKPMNPSLHAMNLSPKTYESVPGSYESVPKKLWIRLLKPMNQSPETYESVPKKLWICPQTDLLLFDYQQVTKPYILIYYLYYYTYKKKRAVFYFFSLWICHLSDGWKSPCIRQIRPLEQLTNISFSGCRVRIRWGQIYNFSRMNDGFAVCFQRLIIFLLSLFFGGVTFLSVNTSGFVGEKLRICR